MKKTTEVIKTYEEYDFEGNLTSSTIHNCAPIWKILEDVTWHNTLFKAGWYFIDETQNVYEKRYDSFDEALTGMNEYAIRELGC